MVIRKAALYRERECTRGCENKTNTAVGFSRANSRPVESIPKRIADDERPIIFFYFDSGESTNSKHLEFSSFHPDFFGTKDDDDDDDG